MEPCRSLALLTSSLGLLSLLVALSTNFWFVAEGPSSSSHSGLWPRGDQGSVEELLHSGCPVGPDLCELSGHVLHPFTVCRWTRPHCLDLHSLCRSPLPASGHGGLHYRAVEAAWTPPDRLLLLLVLLPGLGFNCPLSLCRWPESGSSLQGPPAWL
ncbi:protein NKG7 isoform X3 [Delphinus delphis]|uniref:protein NKG7 isoform X3 n=1 Tax=Delphinus delphis TaxID=9728 RepID=UPI003751CA23